ncbi:MAG: MinD/ParA family protein [Thermodesulfobacteriota bacterium]
MKEIAEDKNSGLKKAAVVKSAADRDAAEKEPVPKGGKKGGLVRVISVTSGKGGVGKTSCVVNIAISFAKKGKRVLVFDADLGLCNLDVMLGLSPKYNINHVLRGEKKIEDVIIRGPGGIMVIPAASGISELTNLNAEQRLSLASSMEMLDKDVDIMMIDTGAGISNNVMFFNTAAQEIVVVVTPEPTSLTDAYALMKVLMKKHGEKSFKLLVNTARGEKEGKNIYSIISLVASRFLNVSLEYLGCVVQDDKVSRAVINQRAVVEMFPDTPASRCIKGISEKLLSMPAARDPKGGMQLFWKNMLNTQVDTL